MSELVPAADGRFTGTVDYVAPEQIRGDAVDGRADEYGLACLVFECLTGTVPYRGASGLGALFAHLEAPLPEVGERRVGLPPDLDAVFARGLAKDPGDRFATCGEFVEAARAALGLDPRPAGLRRRVIAAGLAPAGVPGAPPPVARPDR